MTAIFAIVKRLLASNKISFILTACGPLCHILRRCCFEQWKLHLAACCIDPILFCLLCFQKAHAFGSEQKRLLSRLSHQLWDPSVLYFPGQYSHPSVD